MKDHKLTEDVNLRHEILEDLAFNLYVSQNRYRYQQEQKDRFIKSVQVFDSLLTKGRNPTYEQFVLEYNDLILVLARESNGNVSNKIEANYADSYHKEASAIDRLVFFAYFKSCKWSQLIARVLAAGYRNPSSRKSVDI